MSMKAVLLVVAGSQFSGGGTAPDKSTINLNRPAMLLSLVISSGGPIGSWGGALHD